MRGRTGEMRGQTGEMRGQTGLAPFETGRMWCAERVPVGTAQQQNMLSFRTEASVSERREEPAFPHSYNWRCKHSTEMRNRTRIQTTLAPFETGRMWCAERVPVGTAQQQNMLSFRTEASVSERREEPAFPRSYNWRCQHSTEKFGQTRLAPLSSCPCPKLRDWALRPDPFLKL